MPGLLLLFLTLICLDSAGSATAKATATATTTTSGWVQDWTQVAGYSEAQLEKAITSSKWHVRSSALLQIEKKNKHKALDLARGLLKDPALLVRSQAVRIVGQSLNPADIQLLIDQLDATHNFHRGQSLFIRREILKLVAFEKIKNNRNLISKLANDPDRKIRAYVAAKLGNMEEE